MPAGESYGEISIPEWKYLKASSDSKRLVLAFLLEEGSPWQPHLTRQLKSQGFNEVITASRSPWQNPFVERAIGSIRRDCLNYLIRKILREYSFYDACQIHLSLKKYAPETRLVERTVLGDLAAFSVPAVCTIILQEWQQTVVASYGQRFGTIYFLGGTHSVATPAARAKTS